MKQVYIDTNIFLYANEKKSSYQVSCNKLIQLLIKNKVEILTNAETVQEIIYYSQKISRINFGIKISNQLLTIVTTLISIDKELLLNFLKLIKKNIHHKNIESRDFLHIATCLQYKISTLITFDKQFKKIKEIISQTPEEYLKE